MNLKTAIKQYYWIFIIVGLLGVGYFWQYQNQGGTATPQDFTTMSATSTTSTPSKAESLKTQSKDTTVIVDIKGAIQHPGLYHLKDGDRMADLLKKAGGMTEQADENQVNLAQKLQDQSMIYIPEKGQIVPNTPATPQGNETGDQVKINLNTASLEALQKLDGIGAKKAEKIIDYRENQGQFQTPEDLSKVNGFGEKTVARLQDQITV